ncbi:hypothetical protein BU17DRAFT_100652 [Hysterangium stoloniferum]|nr:hypothetical protein BU17DRAFT_100652 [Hysterangium stoloniferum]
MARTRERSNCAMCRYPFQIAAVIKLFLEYEEPSRGSTSTLLASQKETINAFITASETVDEECEAEQVLKTVVHGEKVLVDLYRTLTDTESESLLQSLGTSLQGLRKRLKLFSRLNELQEKVISLTEERDSLRQVIIDQVREADEAAQAQSRLGRRLKRTNSELEVFQNKERRELAAMKLAMETLTEELEKQKAKSIKFEKKYHATSQEIKNLKKLMESQTQAGYLEEAMPEVELSDDSLEIISIHGSQLRSTADDKARLKEEIVQAIPDKCGRRSPGESGQGKPGMPQKKMKTILSAVAEV